MRVGELARERDLGESCVREKGHTSRWGRPRRGSRGKGRGERGPWKQNCTELPSGGRGTSVRREVI